MWTQAWRRPKPGPLRPRALREVPFWCTPLCLGRGSYEEGKASRYICKSGCFNTPSATVSSLKVTGQLEKEPKCRTLASRNSRMNKPPRCEWKVGIMRRRLKCRSLQDPITHILSVSTECSNGPCSSPYITPNNLVVSIFCSILHFL